MAKVSLYSCRGDVRGFEPVDIETVYEAIKTSTIWKSHADTVRPLPYLSDAYKAAKSKVPAITISGTFPPNKRKGIHLESHSGRIAIDFDGLKKSVHEAKEVMKADQYTEAVAISVGGRGLVVVVKIDPRRHLESFLELEKYYLNNYGLKIDESCKDVNRLRYVTYDEDIYVNMESPVFEIPELDLFLPPGYSYQPEKGGNNQGEHTVSKEIIRRSVEMINDAQRGSVHAAVLRASELAGGYISGGLVDEFEIKEALLAAVLSKPKALSRSQEEKKVNDGIAHGKSKPITELMVDKSKDKSKPKFKDYGIKWFDLNDRQKESYKEILASAAGSLRAGIKPDPSFIQSLAEMNDLPIDKVAEVYEKVFELDKVYFNFDNKPEIDKAEIQINEKYELRHNIVKNALDVRVRDSGDEFEQCNSNDIYRYLQKIRSKYSKANLEALLGSDFVEKYDPFKAFYESLPKWNGEDEIKKLCNYIKTNDDVFFYSMLKKHMIRSIPCSLGLSVNRYVFTLIGGDQNIGKTSFIRWINPMSSKYRTETSINGNVKDLKIALCQNFMMNIDELAGLGKKDAESLKSLISEESVNERMPYGKSTISMPRRINFWASSNPHDFLTDSSNTRWLCFEIESIDWVGYTQAVDKMQMWAQAYQLYTNGDDGRLSTEEAKKQSSINENHNVETPEIAAIRKHFRVCDKHEGEFYSAFEITEKLNAMYITSGIKFSQNRVSQEIKKMGFLKSRKLINGKYVRGFYAEMIMMEYKTIPDPEQKKLF